MDAKNFRDTVADHDFYKQLEVSPPHCELGYALIDGKWRVHRFSSIARFVRLLALGCRTIIHKMCWVWSGRLLQYVLPQRP